MDKKNKKPDEIKLEYFHIVDELDNLHKLKNTRKLKLTKDILEAIELYKGKINE